MALQVTTVTAGQASHPTLPSSKIIYKLVLMCKANIELNLIIFQPILRQFVVKKKTNAMLLLALNWHLKV